MLTALLAAASFLASDPARLAPPAPPPSETSAATAEGTEILRRLLAGGLDDAFQEKKKNDAVTIRQAERLHGVVTALWASNQTVDHSRGFHLPEVGLFFSIDANLPVVEKEPQQEDKDAKEADPRNDEWERARREVRGDVSGLPRYRVQLAAPATETQIDPKAIERTIDTVLSTLARHAGRVEGLAPSETITVALRLNGRDAGLWDLGEGPLAGFHVLGEDEPEKGLPEEEKDEEGKFSFLSRYVVAGTQQARSQNLVIRVTLSALTGGDTSPERLRQRAQINLY